MTQQQDAATPHGVICGRVRELRLARKPQWSQGDLANALKDVGIGWDRSIVASFESGRRKAVSVEEFLALAYVLDVAPVHLMVPPLSGTASNNAPYRIAPDGPVTTPEFARAWIRGQTPIGPVDARRYFAEVPVEEWEPPSWAAPVIAAQSRAVRGVRKGAGRGKR